MEGVISFVTKLSPEKDVQVRHITTEFLRQLKDLCLLVIVLLLGKLFSQKLLSALVVEDTVF